MSHSFCMWKPWALTTCLIPCQILYKKLHEERNSSPVSETDMSIYYLNILEGLLVWSKYQRE